MTITLNGREFQAPRGASLAALRRAHKPSSDIIIYNGAIIQKTDWAAIRPKDGDSVVLIRRGEKPSKTELRHLLYARNTPGYSELLEKTTIGIAGAGGLGSNAALMLARSGVGRLIIADFDLVEPSNLNRQNYSVPQIGMSKVLALKQNIAAANPLVRVDAEQVRISSGNVARIFGEADILIEALDDRKAKAMLASAFCRRFPAKPLILASGLASCAGSNSVRTSRLSPKVYVVGDQKTGAAPGTGLMAPRVCLAACHQANLALRLALKLEK